MPAPEPDYSLDDPVIHIRRSHAQLVLVGAAFFVVGLLSGLFVYDRFAASNRDENQQLLSMAAATFAAAVPASGTVAQAGAPESERRYVVDTAGNPSIGPEDAPVTIVEFGDFHCGYCKRFFDQTLQPLLDQYDGQVRFVFRDYPILGQSSVQAALASECADDQGKFWEFHDLLYQDQNLTDAAFTQYATQLGMDVGVFTTCLSEAQHQQEIVADYQAGNSLGVGGTPTFFVNGRILVGAQEFSAFAALIDEELANAESTPAPA